LNAHGFLCQRHCADLTDPEVTGACCLRHVLPAVPAVLLPTKKDALGYTEAPQQWMYRDIAEPGAAAMLTDSKQHHVMPIDEY